MKIRWFAAVMLAAVPAAAQAPPAKGNVNTLVGAGCRWRYYVMLSAPMVSQASAKAAGLGATVNDRKIHILTKYNDWRGARPILGIVTPAPPSDWMSPGFDDGQWYRHRGALQADPHGTAYPRQLSPEFALICMRARFMVNDPAGVSKLRLSLRCRGGVVVYINGKEVARASLPKGRLSPLTPGAEYPDEATLVGGKAKLLHWFRDRARKSQFALRDRQFTPIDVDPGCLRKGVNVLAVESHRSDFPAACQKIGMNWGPVGLTELHLRAEADRGAATPGLVRRAGLEAWNVDVAHRVLDLDFADPCEPLGAIRIAAARNGTFSGAVAVGSTGPIAGLRGKVGDLKADGGPGRIAASRIAVRYGKLDARALDSRRHGVTAHTFDALLDQAPAEVPLARIGKVSARGRSALGLPPKPVPGAVVPVWLTVKVPRDAPAGLYRGELALTARSVETIRVPIELRVAAWTLPDVRDHVSLLNVYQSPDTLAAKYKLERWSPEHWAVIEKSVALMAGIGNDAVFIPLLSKEQLGNEESMVSWIKQGDGTYKHDFTVMDRYLAAFEKHHDRRRLKMIVFVVWGRSYVRDDATVTLLDPATRTTSDLRVPPCGTPDSERLWRPLLLAARDRLKARGLEKLMLLGMPPDSGPKINEVAMFRRILPEVSWMRASHPDARGYHYDPKDRRKIVPLACVEQVYKGPIPDPAKKRLFGWQFPRMRVSFNRPGYGPLHLLGFASPWRLRMWMETSLAAGDRGAGRIGADYWNMGVSLGRVSSDTSGGNRGTFFQRYLKSAVGQVGLANSTTDLLAPGPHGPVTTIRFENAREGIQTAETVIAIQKALIEKRVSGELADRCWWTLDHRVNVLRLHALGLGSAGWQQRSRTLFDLAALALPH